ncbi:hypothetical protein Pfo_017344 [Paulownia fortunei]|nr:hypothetical protein Pfo_017344 [Paulownia fortunei]
MKFDSLAGHVRTVIADGVKEIWLSSEDTGAYGHGIGVNLLLFVEFSVWKLHHIDCNEPRISCEFRTVVDTLIEVVPGMQIATDIIFGFPGETDEDFEQTINLIRENKFPQVHISQCYHRPGIPAARITGTPAARMKKVSSNVVKKQSWELTAIFESFTPYVGMQGKIERIWITVIATDGSHLVGHTKGYIQVLVVGPRSMLGTSAMMKITSFGRWSVFGEVVEILSENVTSPVYRDEKYSTCSNLNETCCSKESETCACGQSEVKILLDDQKPRDYRSQYLIGWLLRKRKNDSHGKIENELLELHEKQVTSSPVHE